MTVVSSQEFETNQKKYFDMAQSEQVYIQRGSNMFIVADVTTPAASEYGRILEPDEDFDRAISAEEFRKRLVVVLDKVDKKYADKCR